LQSRGIRSVYIVDPLCDDVRPDEVVSETTRRTLIQVAYDNLTQLTQDLRTSSAFRQRRLGPEVRKVVSRLLGEIGAHRGMAVPLSAVYDYDAELYHHSVNVTILAIAIGVKLELTSRQLSDLGVSALLHDVGKLMIPPSVLHKPGKLTSSEYELVKTHTTHGFRLLTGRLDVPSYAAVVAYEHHERLNGEGYPRGIREEQHLYSRIVAVSDVYEALTANRVYRSGYLPHHALEFILGGSAAGFDTSVVEAFIKCVALYPIGATIRLRSGESGVVVASRPEQPQRPVIRILRDRSGNDLTNPYEIDLYEDLQAEIIECEI
ncbi:MAG: HD-GYP domain-containing protein, partial [Bacilli bacterium]